MPNPLEQYIDSIIHNPQKPTAVIRRPFVYLAYDDERITFTTGDDGSIAGVQRGLVDDPIWPLVMANDPSFAKLDDGQTAMLVRGAKRAIADGKLERTSSL